eukprot:TRINITY_DN650_c1_g1_i6.p2 TRINITY_DN650_c1_g1~~TRINITY_DN650_c1_g1_i6.p2  ORF type:complete len:161 (-),score=18.84 TRINITY_DN650_c1_g1_i6:99-533(-)
MLAWMGGSRKKLKEAKNRKFGARIHETQNKKICKKYTPKKSFPRILKSTPVKSIIEDKLNPFERKCKALAEEIGSQKKPPSPSYSLEDADIENIPDKQNNLQLHSKQFKLLIGSSNENGQESNLSNKVQEKQVQICWVMIKVVR